jgi:hypothetical protein
VTDRDPDEPAPGWAAPSGPAHPDPDPTDQREHGAPPPPVTLLPGPDPVAGEAWTVRVQTAAGVSAVKVEIDGAAHDIVMTPEPQTPGQPSTWFAQLPVDGEEPIRYRYAWRSSWTGGVTEWMAATPGRTCGS